MESVRVGNETGNVPQGSSLINRPPDQLNNCTETPAMDSSKAQTEQTLPVDQELDDLLDSALEDFDKLSKASTDQTSGEKKENISNTKPTDIPFEIPTDKDTPWPEEYQQFEEMMKACIREDPQLQEQIGKIAESAAKAVEASSEEEFSASLAETLKGLTENAQSFAEPPSEEEIAKLLSSLTLGASQEVDGTAGEGQMPSLLPFMQNVMQNLLSKDLLYPALHDIVEKYPKWLVEKQTSLSGDDYRRYGHQLELMQKVCAEFETENDKDTQEDKKARFERILSIMHQLQECGQPPPELVEMGPEMQLDEQGNLKMPSLPESCVTM